MSFSKLNILEEIINNELADIVSDANISSAKNLLLKTKKNLDSITREFNQISFNGSQSNNKNPINSSHNMVSKNKNLILTENNSVGYLQEFCVQNGYDLPLYEGPVKSGEDHSPNFSHKCKLTINGTEIVGEGNGGSVKISKKAAAEEVIRKLNPFKMSNDLQTPESKFETKLIKFLTENFSHNSEINVYTEETGNEDYCKKLDKIALIIGSDVKFTESKDNKVVLRLVIPRLNNYVLITSFGSSDEGLKESKEIAAKKAILSLEILNKK
jgi:hypothetical protein